MWPSPFCCGLGGEVVPSQLIPFCPRLLLDNGLVLDLMVELVVRSQPAKHHHPPPP